jgi:Domain of unknown function (DUF4105)
MVFNLERKSIPPPGSSAFLPIWLRVLRALGITVLWIVVALLIVWATAAIYVDCRVALLRIPLTVIYISGIIAILVKFKGSRRAAMICLASFFCVLLWWLTLKPTNSGSWEPNNTRTAWAEANGDRVTIHNLRNCDYRTETDYANCWSDRTIYLSQISGADLFLTNWGLSFASHPIVSFQFGDREHIAFSIEARYRPGQEYSTIRGFFRQYGLIFIVADERDLIRLRTNYRKDEEVYMYRLRFPPETVRAVFLTYVTYLNHLKDDPEWYNAVTRNCTTTLDRQLAADTNNPQPWNYQYLLNGTLDKLLFERGRLVSEGLPFPELKEREHINAAARSADQSPDFSGLIRAGRIGF